MTVRGVLEIGGWPPEPDMTPVQWLRRLDPAKRDQPGPRDSRIPACLGRLAAEVCALRSGMETLRLAFGADGTKWRVFLGSLADDAGIPFPAEARPNLVKLLKTFLSRGDWREADLLEMILEYLESAAPILSRGKEATPGDGKLEAEVRWLQDLRASDGSAYSRALQGLITETRGALMGLAGAGGRLADSPRRFQEFSEELLRMLIDELARAMGLPSGFCGSLQSLPDDPGALWERMLREAGNAHEAVGVPLVLKPLEKASLVLLECLPLERRGHAAFVRHLIEREDAYRGILATCYAPHHVQAEALLRELERFNHLPEYSTRQLHMDSREMDRFLYAFMLRPDVVSAIAEREEQKDIYTALPGLGFQAHLPRVLHEIQNVFGYVTPEAVQRVVEVLRVDPSDVVRLIASYKQFSADRGGDVIIYVCKGTACFLRGQPELSRKIADEIAAEEGEVGLRGIQFIEMDCFGVCHLAPVIKVRDTFLGRRRAEDIPGLLEQLLRGPSYENPLVFLERIQEMLAPGHVSDPVEGMRIRRVVGGGGRGMALEERPVAGGRVAGPGGSGSPVGEWADSCLQIDDSGRVFACADSHRLLLGRLMAHSLCFHYPMPDGQEELGALVLDGSGQVESAVNFPLPFSGGELRHTLKPRGYLEEDFVRVDRLGGALRLGAFTANAMVVESAQDGYRILELSAPPSHAPPEREQGLKVRGAIGKSLEDEDFPRLQDRLLLGFSEGADPENIEAYTAMGGYGSVRRVLGLGGEPRWKPEDVVDQVAGARLRGRGGAGFPTGGKWDAMRRAGCTITESDANQDAVKLIVANGDEGDPGAFMDRTLIQERPHQVLEGMILAAFAVGARYGVIYVRKEYEDAVRRLENAIFQARRKGFLGRDVFGVEGFHFDVDIRLGAGAFVAGEKRAIMRAIEGHAAEPTLNAPSNTVRGLWGKPTLLNNVETFANVPLILQRGSGWYAAQGTENTGGTKIFSVAGIVKRTGLVEVRFGRTLQDVVAICGGIQDGKVLAGVQIGGPSGAILSLTGVRAYLLQTPLDFDAFDEVGAMLGSGGLVFIGEDDDVVRLARHFTDWLAEESCGQCPACFQGTRSLGKNLDVILHGEGTSDHIHALWARSDAIKAGSQCGLGMTASNPVTSALRFFPHAFLHAVLSNSRLSRLELFKVLEALRLIARENVERISGRRREAVGYSFTLKKHLMRNLVRELERLDQYRPPHARGRDRFLDLLQVPRHEVGVRDAAMECSLDEPNPRFIQWGSNDAR